MEKNACIDDIQDRSDLPEVPPGRQNQNIISPIEFQAKWIKLIVTF
jgi:hypothetical protein